MGQAWSDDDARGLREIEPMRERGGREKQRERERPGERERERDIDRPRG